MEHVLQKTPTAVESPAVNYYEAAWIDRRWVIMRRKDGHVFCICRSRSEAEQLTMTLNRDCARDPNRHDVPASGSNRTSARTQRPLQGATKASV